MSRFFMTVPDRLRKRRLPVWLFFILMTVFSAFGIMRTQFDMTLEGWFEDDDPIKVALDRFHADFGSDDSVFIVYKPKDGNVFSEASLKAVQGIREDLLNFRMELEEGETSMLEHIVRVNTLANASVLISDGDLLVSKQLVGSHVPQSEEKLKEIEQTARDQKNFPLLYFSKDGKYGGIFIETDFGTIPLEQETAVTDEFGAGFGEELEMGDVSAPVQGIDEGALIEFKSTDMNDYLDLMEEINAIIYKPEYAGHLNYHPVGNAPLMEYGMTVMKEIGPLYLMTVAVMILLLWILFRSFSAVVWSISIVIMSTVWTVGLAGWLGVTITTMLMLTVMLILAVGTADAIHILSGYLYFRNHNQSHRQALTSAFEKSALACTLTTITTMTGMLALAFTPIWHIEVFGYMSAAGVALALVFTLFLLPLMLDLWAPKVNEQAVIDGSTPKTTHAIGRFIPDFALILQRLLDRIMPIVIKGPVTIILIALGIFGICVYGATQVKVDTNIIEQFKEGASIRETYEIVDDKMMGTQNMIIYVDMGKDYAFQDPQVLKTLEGLQEGIESKYSDLVVRSSSLADIVKDAYQTLNEGREEMYIIPEDGKMLTQTLFLFNNANPEDRRKLVTDNYRKSHITLQLYNAGSHEYTEAFDAMRTDIDQALTPLKTSYPNMSVTITGGLPLMMELSDYITRSQLRSLGLAIAVISVILIFVFGSMRAGLTSIIPNLIPAMLTFGILGLLGIPLDSDTIIIAPVIIGIAVDDTIHFITHYRAEYLIDGDITRALRDTIKEVGQAITFTTLILGLGFSVMAFSSHMGTSIMGRFGTLAIFVALLCDLFVLPAAMLLFKPSFGRKKVIHANAVKVNT